MATKTAGLEVGDKAPAFEGVDEQGQVHRLSEYAGKTLVLYFYPKDHTSGCTTEACDFRDNFHKLARKGASLLGVSPDDAESHSKFAQKLDLQFPLLADTEKKICKAYGVWKEKAMYGRKYMGVERSTFVIGPDGRIAYAAHKVAVPGHANEVLKAI